jgi:hypothetical protein
METDEDIDEWKNEHDQEEEEQREKLEKDED